MSAQNVELVQRMVEAFNAQAIETLVGLASSDCRIFARRSEIEGMFEGREGVRRWAASYYETAPDVHVVAERILATAGDRVVVLGRQTGTVQAAGVPFDAPFAAVAEIEADRVRAVTAYASHAEALAAAGLGD